MANRKKRLEKGISSLQERIDEHLEKKKVAEESGNEERADYYAREIAAKEKTKREKEAILEKQ